MTTPVGCTTCRAYASSLVARGLRTPHRDLTCQSCGERESHVFRFVRRSAAVEVAEAGGRS